MAKKTKAKAEASPIDLMLQEPWVLLESGWHRFAVDPGPPSPGSGQKATTRCGLRDVAWLNYRTPGVGHDNPQIFLRQACQSCQQEIPE
jgi:hypothetical protein